MKIFIVLASHSHSGSYWNRQFSDYKCKWKNESLIFLLVKSLPNFSMENRKFPLWGSRYPKEEANTQMIATEITWACSLCRSRNTP